MRRLRTLIAVLLLGLLGAGGEAPAVLSTPAAQPASPLDRYGVWITATDPTLGPLETARRVLDQLGLRWYATFDHDADTVPPGANKVMALSTRTLASEASRGRRRRSGRAATG